MLEIHEIKKLIEKDKTSKIKKNCRIGRKYYESEHDILNYRVFYFNSDGILVEDTTRSNSKIPHPFFTELVDQEVQYMLSSKDDLVSSDDPELQKHLNNYFDDSFKEELTDVLTDTVVNGFNYMYVYKNSKDLLSFQSISALNVIEVLPTDSLDGKPYVIYYRNEQNQLTEKNELHVEVYDDENIYFYIDRHDGEGLVEDKKFQGKHIRPHIIYEKNDGLYYQNFGYIPFFRLDNNRTRTSGVKPIKALIDDYDMMSCGLSNNLADFDNPIYIVRGFEGDNLDELQQNLKTKKIIGVDDQGDVGIRTIDIPYEARIKKLQEDEKNIYRFGMGFNSSLVGDGNITNVVIKSRYSLLDLKCNKLEIKLRSFLSKIVRIVLDEINKKHDTDYQIEDVYFNLEREIMTNALDNATIEKTIAERKQLEINTLLNVGNVLDDVTLVKCICEVLDIDYDSVQTPDDELKKLFEDLEDDESDE